MAPQDLHVGYLKQPRHRHRVVHWRPGRCCASGKVGSSQRCAADVKTIPLPHYFGHSWSCRRHLAHQRCEGQVHVTSRLLRPSMGAERPSYEGVHHVRSPRLTLLQVSYCRRRAFRLADRTSSPFHEPPRLRRHVACDNLGNSVSRASGFVSIN